jgi:hypothetical protein
MGKPASGPGKTLKLRATFLTLALLLLASLFAATYVAQSRIFQGTTHNSTPQFAGSDESVLMTGWNVTEIGTRGAVSIGNGVIFNDNFVFWSTVNSTDFAITAFSLSNYTFKDVWNANNSFSDGNGVDMKIINESVFAEYTYSLSPSGSYIAMIWSSDLNTWTQYCDFKSILWVPESFCQYTGPGPLNGMIEYGGYVPDTCAAICAWNSTSNSEIVLFCGTVYGSDDVCFLTMFNSTCMIAGDCGPSDIIYTNDGQNWTDEYSPAGQPAYTTQYPFVWGWAAHVSNGTVYVAEEGSMWENGPNAPMYQGGLMVWSGVDTTAAFDYGMTMQSISNGLIGGSAGIWTSSGDYGGADVIYQYSSDGTLGALIWSSNYNGTVKDLTYDPNGAAWYAIIFSKDIQNATVLKITQ